MQNRRYLPAKCASCYSDLVVGLSFYVYICHMHATCLECEDPYGRALGQCPFCLKRDQANKEENWSRDAKNALPLLPTAEPSMTIPGPASLIYGYLPVVTIENVEQYFNHGHIDLVDKASTFWYTALNEHILLGGSEDPTLTVAFTNGKETTLSRCTLSCGQSIVSGAFIYTWRHVICVSYDKFDYNYNEIHIIDLDPTCTLPDIIHPLSTLQIQNPVHVFRKSANLFGALCLHDSTTYSRGRIHIFGLERLVLATDSDPRTFQDSALWGRRTLLHLNLPAPDTRDTVAANSKGRFFILSYERGEVRAYSTTGLYLYTIGENRLHTRLRPGRLFHPVSIECTDDNNLILTGEKGDVQSYNMNSSSGALVRKANYMTKGNDDDNPGENENAANDLGNVYHLMYDPNGWSLLNGTLEGGFVQCSLITGAFKWALDANNSKLHIYVLNS